ncbi:MAG: CpaF family protein [Alphaproteobacteria bacterium]|nr:CpaF family protein [Alphaproteobacteria bacterium]
MFGKKPSQPANPAAPVQGQPPQQHGKPNPNPANPAPAGSHNPPAIPPSGHPGAENLPATVPQQQVAPQAQQTDLSQQQRTNVSQSAAGPGSAQQKAAVKKDDKIHRYTDQNLETAEYKKAKEQVIEILLEKADLAALETLQSKVKKERVASAAKSIISEITIPLNSAQQDLLQTQVIDEILGFGPLESLMADHNVSDIMINGPHKIYLEKEGKLAPCDVTFTSEKHLLNVIQKIVSTTGRRVDETSPMVDARMPDGSRFNAIIPPLALDGSLVSIRKFKPSKMPLSQYLDYGSMSPEMCQFLEIAGNIRLNIIISGGTGSGKTTMLNALSGHIDEGERVITIEDAAELQMHQPHVLRLETRPSNSEGTGEITQRQLVKNALRMRPDRIILGEIRGDEVLDVLAAMNTGHEGSMATIHANNPRDCLSRIENLVGLAGVTIPLSAMRKQIESALNLIVQVSRMRDGARRVTHIEEIVGMEGDTITTQTLFGYKPGPMDEHGRIQGNYYCTGIRPRFFDQAAYFNRDRELAACIKPKGQ